jgi:hypothetical protein
MSRNLQHTFYVKTIVRTVTGAPGIKYYLSINLKIEINLWNYTLDMFYLAILYITSNKKLLKIRFLFRSSSKTSATGHDQPPY